PCRAADPVYWQSKSDLLRSKILQSDNSASSVLLQLQIVPAYQVGNLSNLIQLRVAIFHLQIHQFNNACPRKDSMTSSPTSLTKVQISQKLDKIPEGNISKLASQNPGE
ncbi:MAG TPA: hypothetical protein PLG60_08565, partial [Acidimicrobiales bacterium]|nr:hypothetical protein [Acidimicrobiales bacterium]